MSKLPWRNTRFCMISWQHSITRYNYRHNQKDDLAEGATRHICPLQTPLRLEAEVVSFQHWQAEEVARLRHYRLHSRHDYLVVKHMHPDLHDWDWRGFVRSADDVASIARYNYRHNQKGDLAEGATCHSCIMANWIILWFNFSGTISNNHAFPQHQSCTALL